MNALRTLWDELVGLFIDDATLALAIVAWLAISAAAFHFGVPPMAWRGPLLALGLAAILLENVLRRARR